MLRVTTQKRTFPSFKFPIRFHLHQFDSFVLILEKLFSESSGEPETLPNSSCSVFLFSGTLMSYDFLYLKSTQVLPVPYLYFSFRFWWIFQTHIFSNGVCPHTSSICLYCAFDRVLVHPDSFKWEFKGLYLQEEFIYLSSLVHFYGHIQCVF